MMKKAILTLGVLAIAATGFAQSKHQCATDDFYKEQKAMYPGIEAQEVRFRTNIEQLIKGQDPVLTHGKTTHHDGYPSWPDDTMQFYIPVVVHVISDFVTTNGVTVTDNDIYGMMDRLNLYYSASNPDLANIIAPFKPYIGNAHIRFYLAAKDPLGKPTRGIVRENSYLSNGGDESAKIKPWAPDQYLNIFVENFIGRGATKGIVLAYATFPESYNDNPYSQGVITRADQLFANPGIGDIATLAHEIGHFLHLGHPWTSNGQEVEGTPGMKIACGDDEVDDTPPTIGHNSKCGTAQLYDTFCAKSYVKFYDAQTAYHMFKDSSAASKAKDYPDTTNTQNIMDYSACSSQMFTKGQVARMRATLRSDVGFRDNLVKNTNLIRTGIMDAAGNILPPVDIAPTALFSVDRPFICADGTTTARFTNRSYNDTLSDASWTFSNGGGNATDIPAVDKSFTTTGWVKTSLTVTGTGTGSSTFTKDSAVYAADPAAKKPVGYFQDFNPGGDLNQYPIFNYFGTAYKWEVVNNAGFYDRTSIRYANYDTRPFPSISNATETPGGNFSDFYTPGFDLTPFDGIACNLSFYTAGAFRTTMPSRMTDVFEISASTDCGGSWRVVGTLTGGQIGNNGLHTEPFTPSEVTDWREQSVPVSILSRSDRTYFRFRFISGTDFPVYYGFSSGTGNNFYLDRFTITASPLGVKNGVIVNLGMNVSPNPTTGAATISINGGDNSMAEIMVTDVTGKVTFSNSVIRTSATTKVEIPASALTVKGMYLVKVVTGGATETRKLVVY